MLDFVEKSGLLSPGETVDAVGGLVGAAAAHALSDKSALKKKLVLCFVDDTEVNLEAGKVIKLEPLADAITARAGR